MMKACGLTRLYIISIRPFESLLKLRLTPLAAAKMMTSQKSAFQVGMSTTRFTERYTTNNVESR